MDNIIKDQKQMIQYLHKQAEDHVKTRNMLIEMNEELEKEMNQKDDNINKLKTELKAKDKRLNAFKEDTLNKSVDVLVTHEKIREVILVLARCTEEMCTVVQMVLTPIVEKVLFSLAFSIKKTINSV